MLGQAIIGEKYKENMKGTLTLSKCSENLAFKSQFLLSGPGGVKTF